MTSLTRRRLVIYLSSRVGLAETLGRLAVATDRELMRLASVRLLDVDLDVRELEYFELWPMPTWMVRDGVRIHGWDVMRRYF